LAVGVLFTPPSLNAQRYDEVMKRLSEAGAANPKGRVYSACFGSGDKFQVFDVWASQADFDAFGPILMPILAQMGLDPGQPQISPVHNIVKP
jgi:hypothetical protein